MCVCGMCGMEPYHSAHGVTHTHTHTHTQVTLHDMCTKSPEAARKGKSNLQPSCVPSYKRGLCWDCEDID